MSRVKVWQNEVIRLRRHLQELEGFERPRFGKDMTADRISRITQRIAHYQRLIDIDTDDGCDAAKAKPR